MELDELLQESRDMAELEFYRQKFYFSYSSLSKLMWNPQTFYQMYVLGLREESTASHLIDGKLIHSLILEPGKFNDHYIVSPTNLPTGTMKSVIDLLYSQYLSNYELYESMGKEDITDFKEEVLEIMKDINYHQSLKTDQQRIDKVMAPECLNYWTYLNQKTGKTLIDQERLDFCQEAVKCILNNPELVKQLGIGATDFGSLEVFNEIPLTAELPNHPFNLKGIVDNIVIDHENKTITVNDLKTTTKQLKDFKESVEYFNYKLQAAIYLTLVGRTFQNLLEKGYEPKMNFVVIDSNYQCYKFPVTDPTMEIWLDEMMVTLDKAKWHYENRSFDLPYEFATGSVML